MLDASNYHLLRILSDSLSFGSIWLNLNHSTLWSICSEIEALDAIVVWKKMEGFRGAVWSVHEKQYMYAFVCFYQPC